MRLKEYNLTSKKSTQLKTEILFNIASAKASNFNILIFNIEELSVPKIIKILRTVKNENLIQLYALSTDFKKETTETFYLLNKFPMIQEIISNRNDIFIILKI